MRDELHLNKEQWKSKKKKAWAVAKRQGWCTHNGRCNVCSHCLPVSWRFAAANKEHTCPPTVRGLLSDAHASTRVFDAELAT